MPRHTTCERTRDRYRGGPIKWEWIPEETKELKKELERLDRRVAREETPTRVGKTEGTAPWVTRAMRAASTPDERAQLRIAVGQSAKQRASRITKPKR